MEKDIAQKLVEIYNRDVEFEEDEPEELSIIQIFPEDTTCMDIRIQGLLAIDSPLTGEELEDIGKIVHQEKQNEEWSYDILQHKIKDYLKKHRKILKIKKFDMFI